MAEPGYSVKLLCRVPIHSKRGYLAHGDSKDGTITPGFSHGLASGGFGDHFSENTKHGGTSVVEFDVQLTGLEFRVFDVFSEPANSVVSVVLGGRQPGELDESHKGEDLDKSGSRDVGKSSKNLSSNAGRVDVGELKVGGLGDVSVENDSVSVDDLSDAGNHANTSVLALDGTTAFEVLWFSVQPSKRIVDTKRFGDTKLKFVDVEGGGDLNR